MANEAGEISEDFMGDFAGRACTASFGRGGSAICAALGISAGAPPDIVVSDLGSGDTFAGAVAVGVLSAVPSKSDCGDCDGGGGLDSQLSLIHISPLKNYIYI